MESSKFDIVDADVLRCRALEELDRADGTHITEAIRELSLAAAYLSMLERTDDAAEATEMATTLQQTAFRICDLMDEIKNS